MESKPVVKLEQVHLPCWRVAPGRPEHVELWEPELPALLWRDVPAGGQEQGEVLHPRRHASRERKQCILVLHFTIVVKQAMKK